jgi:polygalacturonase
MKRINVTKYGVIPNTNKLLTNQIQNLINNHADDEVEIYFPKGKYILSTLFLKSNISINIAKGAFVYGSDNFDNFASLEEVKHPMYQDISHSYFNCSLFVAKNCKNITFKGKGTIDMQSVWDEKNKNNNVHRGAKVITLVECNDVLIENLTIKHATDLAVYFVSSKNVVVRNLNLNVFIDGISPDNSKNVLIENCKVISGDDAIVFKSSYNLNKLDECRNITVRNCNLISRCNAIKFGTESNGGFKDIFIKDINIKNTRMVGIAIESVDGAIINNIQINNIFMQNVNAPFFIHLGKRMRGPENLSIGSISNIKISNVKAVGPYVAFKTIPWNYLSYVNKQDKQYHWNFWSVEKVEPTKELINQPWQFTSNICGLPSNYLKNISLKNIFIELAGGVKKGQYEEVVKDNFDGYPEVFVYGWTLPSSGLFFRHIRNLKLQNINFSVKRKDERELIIFDDII